MILLVASIVIDNPQTKEIVTGILQKKTFYIKKYLETSIDNYKFILYGNFSLTKK